VAGVLFTVIVSIAVDVLLHTAHFYPPMGVPLTDTQSMVATAYRVVIGVAGAWITAWLAPSDPMRHALILGVVGTALALLGVIISWNAGLGPRWYPIALVVFALPQCWLGGRIFMAQSAGASA
jgi:hypothetical protein